ncbi:MAG: type II toxin-antitoxin system RelB/DinJ family antitoxin [Ruminococcaceae bacterium]|nr:type II toxin-antitoxin system RelB/DinJ family antitoxin [Oscillospiraceae bacterium]
MAQTNVNIRLDEETKKAFDAFCNEIGISVSAAFNIFAKTVVREQRIPFDISTRTPNADTIAAMNEYYEMKAHPEKYKRYPDFKSAVKDVLENA